jgi:glycosyltransferase involved in cell wall biosynthesis
MSSGTFPLLSIVIPVYNGGDSFRECLSSLKQYLPQTPELNVEIIVVGDGDTDGSSELAQKLGARVFRIETNQGPAKARNLGAQKARGEILFFIDADVAINALTVPQVIKVFQDDPALDAVIGSYDDLPGAPNFLSQYKNLFHHFTHQSSLEEASTFWGACGAIRRDVFWAVGGFDENYRHPSIEDIELGYRLKKAKYSIRLCKMLQVKHLKHWKPISLLKAEIFYRAIPWTNLLLRDRQLKNDLNLNIETRISVILVFGLLLTMPWIWISQSALIIAFGIIIALLAINAPVYQFFLRKRGTLFTLQVIPWHWLYFLYSGLSFGLGASIYLLRKDLR